MKRGQITIWLIIGVIVVATIFLVMIVWLSVLRNVNVEDIECSVENDCAPKDCCNANACVPVIEANDCSSAPSCNGCFSPSVNVSGVCKPCTCLKNKCVAN